MKKIIALLLLITGTANAAYVQPPYIVGKGGTGLATLSAHGVILGEGTSPVSPLSIASNQLLVGVAGADPVSALLVDANVSGSAAIAYSKLNLALSIVNADINAGAAIAYSKLNLSGSIVNADVAAGAAIAFSKLAALPSADILVGSVGNVATAVAVSGDVTISNAGVTAIGSSKVVNSMLANMANNTVKSNISGGAAAPSDNSLSAIIDSAIGGVQGDILYRNGANWVVLAPGTSGQFLQTQGAAANPVWANDTESLTTVVDGGNAAYTILSVDGHVRTGTTLTADRAYTLPVCDGSNIGEKHEVKNTPAMTHNIILTAAGTDNIDGNATVTLNPGDSVPVICSAFAAAGTWDIE